MRNKFNYKPYSLGITGEHIAADYLMRHQYSILHNRYKTKFGEIDLIAEQDKTLVFVEVKLRSNITHYEFITNAQIKRHVTTAKYFIANHPKFADYIIRFDLIVVSGSEIHDHIQNAWSS